MDDEKILYVYRYVGRTKDGRVTIDFITGTEKRHLDYVEAVRPHYESMSREYLYEISLDKILNVEMVISFEKKEEKENDA